MKYLTIENAIQDFVDYAKIRGITSREITDPELGNLAYDKMVKAYKHIKLKKAFDEMKLLLTHEDTFVRLWSILSTK